MTALNLKREGHLIFINNPDTRVKLRYNLKLKCMEKYVPKKNDWHQAINQYAFFRPFSISDLQCEEEHFKKLIVVTEKMNPRCTNLSSFFSRMHEALVYENYEREGLETECHVNHSGYGYLNKCVLTKPLEFYHRDLINFFKKYKLKITVELEKVFISDYQLMKNIVMALSCLELEENEIKDFFSDAVYRIGTIKELIKSNYEIKALINYVVKYLKPFENLRYDESLTLLNDYYSMANKIGRDVKKYPKYLRSIHDIISANYNASKESIMK